MKRLTALRVVVVAVGLSLGLALTGLTWGILRFGLSDATLASRLESNVRAIVHDQAAAVEFLSDHVAAEGRLIVDATSSRERLSDLFERLRVLASQSAGHPVAVTVYVPAAAEGGYRVLAWSDGPGEQNLSTDRLSGPSALFVAPGYAGLRLVAVEPVVSGGSPVAVAVAETVLAPADRRLATSYGPVPILAHYAGAGDTSSGDGFTVASASGAPLIEARAEASDLAGHRRGFLRRVLGVALLPLPVGLSVLVALWHDRRTRAAGARARWARLGLFVLASVAVVVVGGVSVWLAALPRAVTWVLAAAGLLVIVTRLPSALWWHAGSTRRLATGRLRFVGEHLGGGVMLAAGLELVARLLDRWMTLDILGRGPFVLFPVAVVPTLSSGTVLLVEAALAWAVAIVLAALAIRWRLLPVGPRTVAAVSCWWVPTLLLVAQPVSTAARAAVVVSGIALVAVVCSLAVASRRRLYRRTTQSVRLALALVAGLVPLLALYPLAAHTAARATRHVIETSYAPATAGHPQELRAELERAQRQVDAMMAGLAELVSGPPSSDSQAAFLVWSQTGLERSRVISDVELYGPDRVLVSRFAFNLPEYVYRSTLQPWQGSSCTWEVFGEVTPFGAEERLMLHAERAVCDERGEVLGGVVLHVASNDYQALPFISSPSPYRDVVGGDEEGPRLQGVRLAVYGWSSQPIFTSERAAWAVPASTFDRLYRTGEPFWLSLSADDGTFDVHFSQNRAGIYALGVPRVTPVEHATRLAEIAVLVVFFFMTWQAALLLHGLLARRQQLPLRQLFVEVRTSFYRKLFIAFVVVAVVPVLAAAVAFGGYMTARFRADVEYEASMTVTVARRVFQELTASGERNVDFQAAPSDDVMVWIRQVIGHDVNLFDGSELEITSQRDLFDSGFLPTRTPAAVYRAIALERRPSFVVDDATGPFSHVVAAAPVTVAGRDKVLTVPLAPRQREMERELDTLNRRVLVGAVFVVLFAAGFGASLAGRIADPVARLSRATRQIAAGQLDVRVATDTADELRRLVDDFNSMAATLGAQQIELARTNQLKAWNEMARQVAHEIKNPLTPVQLAAEHLQHVHNDRGRPLGGILDQCIGTVLAQVRLLRQIASEFANFAGEPTPRPAALDLGALMHDILEPYRVGLGRTIRFEVAFDPGLPRAWADRTLLSRALTNLVENAVQAMPAGGSLRVTGRSVEGRLVLELVDTGVGMDALAVEHAFEPYFSTKTGGSGLGLANARRNIEREGGSVTIISAPGQGARVTVTLPEAPPERATHENA